MAAAEAPKTAEATARDSAGLTAPAAAAMDPSPAAATAAAAACHSLALVVVAVLGPASGQESSRGGQNGSQPETIGTHDAPTHPAKS